MRFQKLPEENAYMRMERRGDCFNPLGVPSV